MRHDLFKNSASKVMVYWFTSERYDLVEDHNSSFVVQHGVELRVHGGQRNARVSNLIRQPYEAK